MTGPGPDLECRECGATATYADASIMDAITGEARATSDCPGDTHGTHNWAEIDEGEP